MLNKLILDWNEMTLSDIINIQNHVLNFMKKKSRFPDIPLQIIHIYIWSNGATVNNEFACKTYHSLIYSLYIFAKSLASIYSDNCVYL